MPIVNKANISLGLGTLEFGNYVNNVFQGYTDVGAVRSELTIEHNREVKDFETGRPMVVIVQEVVRESVTIKATLAEMAMATIKQSLGQGNVSSSVTTSFLDGTNTAPTGFLQTGLTSIVTGTLLTFGGLPSHAYIGLRFTHAMISGLRHIFEGYYASPTGQLTLPFRETDWNMHEVTFRLLANTTLTPGSQYYQFFKEGAA
jgi:hypothetical protein